MVGALPVGANGVCCGTSVEHVSRPLAQRVVVGGKRNTLGSELVLERPHCEHEFALEADELGRLEREEAVDGDEVAALCEGVLRCRLVEVGVEHLDEGVAAVDVALVHLREESEVVLEGARLRGGGGGGIQRSQHDFGGA